MSGEERRRSGELLHKVDVDLASLPFNRELYDGIVKDMHAHADRHAPAAEWMNLGGREPVGVESLMRSWLGFAATPVTEESLFWYRDFLLGIDWLGLVPDKAGTIADLGTMIDLNLGFAFVNLPAGPINVVEIGGGYGRLAEAAFNVFDKSGLRWLIVDAVPASLIYAHEYLTRACPDIRVGFYYNGQAFCEDFDCYIAPSWHIAKLIGLPRVFDLAINVNGFQEMTQWHVDFYLDWFDRVLRKGGVAYFCNRRDHLFRGKFKPPDSWECLLKMCTPRSLTRDYPAEVWRPGTRSYHIENDLRDALYVDELRGTRAMKILLGGARGHRMY